MAISIAAAGVTTGMATHLPVPPPRDGMPDFDTRILPALQRLPCFRLATAEEINSSYAAYARHDIDGLLDAWRQHASPTRGQLRGLAAWLYGSVGTLPLVLRQLSVLATLRAVLRAGERFRQTLKPATHAALQRDFPWLEGRHPHIPPGWAPHFDFPDLFREFLDSGSLDDACVRWQLCAALNEVQQCCYSRDLATRFQLPALLQQADRERALALNYFAHQAPAVTIALWRQCILVLDGLNAAVLQMTCSPRGPVILMRSLLDAWRVWPVRPWQQFLDGLQRPQPLLLPPAGPRRPPAPQDPAT